MPEDAVVPTGITSLDSQVGGGFPPGSLVVMLSEVGAGSREFAMTSATMTGALKDGRIEPVTGGEITIPEKCWWITFSRSPEDVMEEVSKSFDDELVELFQEMVEFKDFSEEYFRFSSVPGRWVSEEYSEKERGDKLAALSDAFSDLYRKAGAEASRPKRLLETLADFLTEKASGNLVVLHTLTDLARLYGDTPQSWYDFTLFLRGLQRASKEWGGLILADVTAGLFEPSREQEISACADGVMRYEWESTGATGKRRTMYFSKFRGLLPRIKGASTVRFQVNITSSAGFEIASAELIEGLE